MQQISLLLLILVVFVLLRAQTRWSERMRSFFKSVFVAMCVAIVLAGINTVWPVSSVEYIEYAVNALLLAIAISLTVVSMKEF